MKCQRCNGTGIIIIEDIWKIRCTLCLGKKELDWIEEIFGVDEVSIIDCNWGIKHDKDR